MTEDILASLAQDFAPLEEVRRRPGYLHVKVDRLRALEMLLRAKDRYGKKILQLISVVDRMEDHLFQMTWILEDPRDSSVLIVSADYPRENCQVPTLGDIWPAAVIFERELHEMYGIDFPGNPRQNEDFLLEGWTDIPPMRRDFDSLEYSMRVFGERQERRHIDPRQYIGEFIGEWNTPRPIKGDGE